MHLIQSPKTEKRGICGRNRHAAVGSTPTPGAKICCWRLNSRFSAFADAENSFYVQIIPRINV